MKKYLFTGDYEDSHRRVKLVPGEIVELPDVPPRLQQYLTPVKEQAKPKAVVPSSALAPAKPKKVKKIKKTKGKA